MSAAALWVAILIEFEFFFGDDGIVRCGAAVPCGSGLLPKHWRSVPSPPLCGRCLGSSARAADGLPHYLLVPLSPAAFAWAARRRQHAQPFGCTARCPLCGHAVQIYPLIFFLDFVVLELTAFPTLLAIGVQLCSVRPQRTSSRL